MRPTKEGSRTSTLTRVPSLASDHAPTIATSDKTTAGRVMAHHHSGSAKRAPAPARKSRPATNQTTPPAGVILAWISWDLPKPKGFAKPRPWIKP